VSGSDSRGRRRRARAVGFALAAAAVGVAAAAGAAASPSVVVPWLDQHPRKASARPPLALACRAHDLRAQLFLQGATGSLVGGVDLRNVGKAPCALLGWPRVSFTGAGTATTHWQVKKLAASPAPPDVLADPPGSLRALRPGKTASVSLFWSNWCGPGAQPTGASGTPPEGIAVGLSSGTTITVPLTRAPRCDAPQDPSIVSVGPFIPAVRRLPESSRLPLRAAIVGPRPVRVKPGLRAFGVHRGQLLRYQVALTNTGQRAFRFAPSSCPVYIEALTPAAPQAYVLNCRPVATIAAGATVLFAMQIRVPASVRLGVTGLNWELAPKTYEAPFATAALAVAP
jgi:hypothetical protein